MTLKQIISKIKERRSWRTLSAIALILLAGTLIELMSLLQYRYIHNMMETELDYRTESELTLKAVHIKSLLSNNENLVRNYLWPLQHQINKPDNIYGILKRLVSTNPDVMSSFVAFVPGYFPDRDELLELSAVRKGDDIVTGELSHSGHDYTQRQFYSLVVEKNIASWTDPYLDAIGSGEKVTTFAMPLHDTDGKIAGVFGIDLSTQGIIDKLNTKHNYPSTFYLLLTEDGHLISQPDSSHTQDSDVNKVVRLINDSTYQREPSSTCISKIVTFQDKEKGTGYAYYAFMKGQPHWQIVMVCYDNEVFGKLNSMRRNLLLMLLAGFSLLGFILYRVNQYSKRLQQSRLTRERTDSELRIAQKIQSEMLPNQGISRPDVDVSGEQTSALEVGGDLYDYFIRDEKLFFCIGDVSGKGIPSSLVMAVVHSFFRSVCQQETNPAHIMQAINESACQGNKTNMFVTMFIGVLDLPTGRLRYCNAGHDAPLLVGDGVKPLPVNANLPLGLFDDIKYVQQHEQLQNGTTLFLYTDGLTEASNPSNKLFGLQRIIDAAQHCLEEGQTSPSALMEAMYQQVGLFVDGAQQSDDLTMLAIHYHRPEETIVLQETQLLTNDVKQVPQLNQFIQSVSGKLNLDRSLTSQLMLAVEEAVVNVMSYAYPLGTKGDITIEARATDQWLKFIITDEGKAFDPTQNTKADTTLNAEDRPIGGLGILLVQQLMDTINYERIDGKNVLTLKKIIQTGDNK